jgi:hypothetical protein
MLIHGTLLTAVQLQPVLDVTVMAVPGPPKADIGCEVGLTEYEQGAGACACVTVNVWPATVRVPVRGAPVLAATVKPTLPLPEPLAPDVTVIQDALLVAVHVHPAVVVTAMGDPLPPPDGSDWLVGLME